MKIKSKNLLIGFIMMFLMFFSALGMNPIEVNASGSVRVDFCLTNGALENNVFFENDSSKYFMSQQTKADGTLYFLEELYRTDSLDLEFDGWYTEDNEKVTLETVFTEYTILYDRWKETTLTDEDIISTLEIGTPLLEVGETAGTYDVNSVTLTDSRLTVAGISIYEGLNAYRTNKLDNSDVLEAGKSYSLRVELHTKNGELIDDQLMNHSTATYGLVANMVYSHDNSGIFTTQWTNRENKIQVIINYDFENYCFTSDLEDKVVENGQSPQYTVYVSNNANIQGMELFVKNANDTWASLGAVTGQFNIPENSNVVKQYRVEVTYQNGFVISSNTFTVDWYDPNAPKFITQPTDYDVAYGTNVLVTWGLNCDVSAIYLEKFDGENYSQYQNATPTGATVNAFVESGTYTFRVHAIKDGDNIYSEDFTITWREKFVFTTQPQSITVSTGESAIVTWETNLLQTALQTLQIFKIESCDENQNWNHSSNLSEDATSFDFGTSYSAYSKKYRLMANYDGTLYYSDEFTVEFIAGEFTSKPADEINAIVGKDCLIEWDFNLDVKYYDIKVYEGNDYVPFATTNKPEYNFTASEVGKKQFFIQAYNANDEKIGEDYLLFTITWTEQQIVYLVSFNANGGSGTMQSFEKNAGSNYVLPNCTYEAPENYVYKTWDVNGVEKQPGDEITITSNTIIKAIWEEIPTFIVAYGPGNGNGNTDFDYVEEGTEVTLLTPTELGFTAQEGMQFSHWNVCKDNASDPNALAKQPGDIITITYETYIIAIWEEIPTFIVAYGPGNGNGNTDFDYVEEGTEVTLLTPTELGFTAQEGMQFSHWNVCKDNASDPNAVEKQPGDTIIITYETYIIAIWEPIPHECVGLIESGQGATCTEDGWKDYYQCSCGKYYEDENCTSLINDLGAWKQGAGKITAEHTGNPQWIQTATTHTKEYDCCHTAIVEEEPHEWQNGVCSECQYVCLHGNSVKKDGQDASCTENGWKDYYQCECGKLFADENCTSPINDFDAWKQGVGKITAEHHYGDLIPEESAVHTQNELKGGTKAHYHCDVCDSYFDEDKNPTTLLALTIEQPTHIYGDWIKDDDNHWKTCSCGLKGELDAHNYTDNDDMICDTCGYDRTIPHTHGNGQLIEGQDASCTLNGWKDYYQCSCGKIYSDSACTHEITSFEEWKNNEGKITAEHNYGELIEKEEATCSSAGFESHYECSVCHALFDEEYNVKTENELLINIDPTAHAYGDWTSNGDDTHSRVCSLNAEHKETAPCSGGESTTTEKAICEVCHQPYGDLKVPDHVHEETGDWKHDENYHWKECECGTPGEKVAHSGGTATETEKAICEICGTSYGELKQHTHDYSDEWKTDGNNHWHECECGEKKDTDQHKDENSDGKCDVCDYQMSEQTPTPQPKDGLSGGVIAIIVTGSVLVLGVSGFALVWFVIKKKKFSDLIALFKK